MNEIFITKIQVNESRNIRDLTILLSDRESKHLIITGKNGSGKTSLLNDLSKYLNFVDNTQYLQYPNQLKNLNYLEEQLSTLSKQLITDRSEAQKKQLEDNIIQTKKWIKQFDRVEISFTANTESIFKEVNEGNYLIAFFDAKRHSNVNVPNGITKINLKKKYRIGDKARQDFIQYIVNLKADRSFARDEGEKDEVRKIDKWFNQLQVRLQTLFECPTLQLKFDRKNYNFNIIEDNKLPFSFNTLSDGYSAIISIASELLLRMEGHGAKAYDLQGVVLIDEIETHLHVELQKRVLPFLSDFFPKIQFIVTTHSPFILSSVSNAVVCDLESGLVTDDLSGYSYDAIIESYFNSDKYSEEIKQKILIFEKLSSAKQLNDQQKDELRQLRNYFVHVPKYLSKELMVKLQQIELQNLLKKDNK